MLNRYQITAECEGLLCRRLWISLYNLLDSRTVMPMFLHSFRNGYQIDFSRCMSTERSSFCVVLYVKYLFYRKVQDEKLHSIWVFDIMDHKFCEMKTFIEILCFFKWALISKNGFYFGHWTWQFLLGNAKSYIIIAFGIFVLKLGHKMLSFLGNKFTGDIATIDFT